MGSFNMTGENKATHRGTVETRTTELATVVYSRDFIQVEKWTAKNTPDNTEKRNSFFESELSSSRFLEITNGDIKNVAIANL